MCVSPFHNHINTEVNIRKDVFQDNRPIILKLVSLLFILTHLLSNAQDLDTRYDLKINPSSVITADILWTLPVHIIYNLKREVTFYLDLKASPS